MDANELRHLAHEIIIQLFEAGEAEHLRVLHMHTERALEELTKAPTAGAGPVPDL